MKKLLSVLAIPVAVIVLFLFSAFTKNSNASLNNNLVHSQDNNYNKPNIIFIFADDIGYEVPTYTGGQSYTTPNIDSLAAQSIQFTQCRSMPNCSPSRIQFITGRYNFRNYVTWGLLDRNERTFVNVLHDAGYKTCATGKWQFDGGDTSVKAFGFDDYRIFNPLLVNERIDNQYRYKNPHIYEKGEYWPASKSEGKYADDIFTDYVNNYIDKHQDKPFFIYYALSLCHTPYGPTPDDSAFATWNPEDFSSDKSYFPSMVKYMDKKVGEIVNKVKNSPQADNTIIFFVGDNGTPDQFTSLFNGVPIQGGKGNSTEHGTHVPMLVYWPAKITTGRIDSSLIDFTDFLPTMADLAGTSIPDSLGLRDGNSIFQKIIGAPSTEREWIFGSFNPSIPKDAKKGSKNSRYVQNSTYKLYDTSGKKGRMFYNLKTDVTEQNPIPDSLLTPQELIIQKQFLQVLKKLNN